MNLPQLMELVLLGCIPKIVAGWWRPAMADSRGPCPSPITTSSRRDNSECTLLLCGYFTLLFFFLLTLHSTLLVPAIKSEAAFAFIISWIIYWMKVSEYKKLVAANKQALKFVSGFI